jgi:hypothetical protein
MHSEGTGSARGRLSSFFWYAATREAMSRSVFIPVVLERTVRRDAEVTYRGASALKCDHRSLKYG